MDIIKIFKGLIDFENFSNRMIALDVVLASVTGILGTLATIFHFTK